ncbi:MAG TPA: antibiotic biosynthesis monooxygenase [Polyangia bacterium]
MVLTVFRSRLRPGLDLAALERLGARMYELAAQMPGFISYKDFTAADGEGVSLVEFESVETLLAWREHPEHEEAQRLGREQLFEEYRIQIGVPSRTYRFPR